VDTGTTEEPFKAALEAAITRRENQYSNFLAFHFHWEDDMGASRDEQNFSKLAKLMGFDPPDVYIIPLDSKSSSRSRNYWKKLRPPPAVPSCSCLYIMLDTESRIILVNWTSAAQGPKRSQRTAS
jgi:hypothetical protein